MGETVTHIRRGVQTGTDRYGKPVFSDVSNPVEDVAVEPTQSVIDPRTGAVTERRGFTLYLPPTETAGPDDRFTVRGRTYKTTGSTSDWTDPFTGWTPGNVVVLEESEYVNG